MPRLLTVLVAGALLLVGCGGGSEDAATTTPTTTTAGGGATTTAPAGTAPTTTAGATGTRPAEFCASNIDDFEGFNPADQNSLRQLFVEAERNLDRAAAAAPAEIRPDVQVMVDAYRPFVRALIAADFDFSRVDQSAFAPLTSPQVQASAERVGAYYERVCGTG
jgi:hypothetical protein